MKLILLCASFYPSFKADIMISLIGAIIGIGGAFLIYKISIKQVRKDRLRYIVTLIQGIVTFAKQQAINCKEHSESILADPFGNHPAKLQANSDVERLAQRTDQEGVYHAYLWKYGRKVKAYHDFKNLYGRIDFLDIVLNDLIKVNGRIAEHLWQRKKDYKASFQKLKELIQTISLDEDSRRNLQEFVEFSEKALQDFLNRPYETENMNESYSIVVKPIREFIARKARTHPRVTEIYFQLNDLVDRYNGIELQSKHDALDYTYYANALDKAADELDRVSQQLQNDFKITKKS